jgi:hypothetical protein
MPDYKKKLCQIQINASTGLLPARRYYQCGLNGRYRLHLVGVTWADRSANAADNKLITIQSDCFRMPYGSVSQAITFCNRSEHNNDLGGQYPIDVEVMGNNIDFTITSSVAYTNAGNNVFDFGILSFTVEPLDD